MTEDLLDGQASQGRSRLRYLDGWRGLAILAVLAGHFIPALHAAGNLGVELFFVLSGRLMAQILLEERYPLASFFVRRFTRIYPAMFVMAVTIFLIGHAQLKQFAPVPGPRLADLLAALTFTINYRTTIFGYHSVLDHLWSICVEEHCYLALACIAFVTNRNAQVAAIIALTCAVLAMGNGIYLSNAGYGGLHEIYWRSDVRLSPVFASFAIYLVLRNRTWSFRWWPGVFMAAGVTIFISDLPLPVMMTAGTTLLAVSVNSIDFGAFKIRRALSVRILAVLGLCSYSFYLWQQPFYVFALKNPGSAGAMFLLAIIAGYASFRLIEQPTRSFLNRRWAERSKPELLV